MKRKSALACTVCGSRNYSTTGSKVEERIELKKFCKRCNTHTLHKETK